MSKPSGRLVPYLFWLCVDRFGSVVLFNLLGLLLCLPIVTAPLALAGGAHVSRLLIVERRAWPVDFFTGMRRYGLRAYALCLGLAFGWIWCLLALFFYAFSGLKLFWAAAGITLALSLLLFLAAFSLRAIPHFFSDISWKEACKRSLSDVLTRPGQSLGILFVAGLGKAVLMLSGIGVLIAGFLWPLLLACFYDARNKGQLMEETRGLRDLLYPRL